jgi:hypothetical protein
VECGGEAISACTTKSCVRTAAAREMSPRPRILSCCIRSRFDPDFTTPSHPPSPRGSPSAIPVDIALRGLIYIPPRPLPRCTLRAKKRRSRVSMAGLSLLTASLVFENQSRRVSGTCINNTYDTLKTQGW